VPYATPPIKACQRNERCENGREYPQEEEDVREGRGRAPMVLGCPARGLNSVSLPVGELKNFIFRSDEFGPLWQASE
jgi:hypothetical protein